MQDLVKRGKGEPFQQDAEIKQDVKIDSAVMWK